MASANDSTPSLTPSRSASPNPPIQPDHFYSADPNEPPLPSSPHSCGRTWLSPDDDPLATRGIPVFKPSMDEFRDFEAYMNGVECWGMRSGIVKVVPPKEWSESLPSILPRLSAIRVKRPIEQHMLGRAGLFRQENLEKRNVMSVREWAELCEKEDFKAPGVDDVALKASGDRAVRKKKRAKREETVKEETAEPEPVRHIAVKVEEDIDEHLPSDLEDVLVQPVSNAHDGTETHSPSASEEPFHEEEHCTPSLASETPDDSRPRKRRVKSRTERDAALGRRGVLDEDFVKDFEPSTAWLPPNTKAGDYTPEFCAILERRYWRNCGLGKPPWYGADSAGSLFTDETTSWNVAHLPSLLSRLLPSSGSGLPGVNMPYLYFGMWRATFAWHVEDMDLFSINYIHFGAPKHWYAVPQGRAVTLENTMRSFFPRDTSKCRQFLRHKSFLASPNLLQSSACKPNILVQHAGEFVITYPRGYHAGFNLGFNCAESVNFALESWLDIGRKAQVCGCVGDSVRIDVDELLLAREEERLRAEKRTKPRSSGKSADGESSTRPRKRKTNRDDLPSKAAKKPKTKNETLEQISAGTKKTPTVMLKVPLPKDHHAFPCCLCISRDETALLRVHDVPGSWVGHSNHLPKDEDGNEIWRAHEYCAMVIPETWVDEISIASPSLPSTSAGGDAKEKVVFGVDSISKDRWNLKCTVCQKGKHKAHGAPIQCTKGKCPKAFHISCAKNDPEHRIQYEEKGEVEKEVILNDFLPAPLPLAPDEVGANDPIVDDRQTTATMDIDVDVAGVTGVEQEQQCSPESNVVKTIRKIEYELLCSQHNPVIAAAKRASKQDRVRTDLLALPEMARIKLRVSTGVFEVSLLRVVEERNVVEVLWDGGHRKEFSWNSVVWGKTVEGQPIGQKPSVLAEQQPTNPRVEVMRMTLSDLDQAQSSSPAPLNPTVPVGNTSTYVSPQAFAAPPIPRPQPYLSHHLPGRGGFTPYSPYSAPAPPPLPVIVSTTTPAPSSLVLPYGAGTSSAFAYRYYPSAGYTPAAHPQIPVHPYSYSSIGANGACAYPYAYAPIAPAPPAAGRGKAIGRYSMFYMSDPASLAAQYAKTAGKAKSVTPTPGPSQQNDGDNAERPSTISSTISAPSTSSSIQPSGSASLSSCDTASINTTSTPLSTGTATAPSISREALQAAAAQVESLTGHTELEPQKLLELLQSRSDLRDAAKLLLVHQAQVQEEGIVRQAVASTNQ